MELLQRTATLPRGSGQSNCCNKAPHCLGPRGSATAVMHFHTILGQWVVELLQCGATVLVRSG